MMQDPVMSLLKHLLPLAALLLLSNVPTEARVVTSMADCNEFFLQQTSPHILGILERGNILNQNRYKVICQTLGDIRTFVTLYDTHNRIPVFSAAKYRGDGKKTRRPRWMIEPQLEDPTDSQNMRPSDNSTTYNNQAGNRDYRDRGQFDRGHLFPFSYGFTKTEKKSTCTLTNAVPQQATFNKGSWSDMEKYVKHFMNKNCINIINEIEGYVVTGAQPSNGSLLNTRINIPSMLWSAFCCYNHPRNTWLTGAFWSENVADEPTALCSRNLTELSRTLGVEPFPVPQCYPKPKVSMGRNFVVFIILLLGIILLHRFLISSKRRIRRWRWHLCWIAFLCFSFLYIFLTKSFLTVQFGKKNPGINVNATSTLCSQERYLPSTQESII